MSAAAEATPVGVAPAAMGSTGGTTPASETTEATGPTHISNTLDSMQGAVSSDGSVPNQR